MNIIVKGKKRQPLSHSKVPSSKIYHSQVKNVFFFQSHKCQKYADMCACNTQLMSPSTRQLGLFQMTHLSHQVINICAYVSTSAAVIGLLRLFFPSQPQGGAVDLGGPGLC